MRTESLDTTVLYVIDAGGFVLCPSAQNLAFLLKFSPSLTSKTRCPVISWYPINSFGSPSCSSKATIRFFISSWMASIHNVFPLFLSISFASPMLLGTRIPYLCVRCQYFDFNFLMILVLFLRVYGTHHAKAGSSVNPLFAAYSASSMGYESFRSLSAIQSVDPSFHWAHNSQPRVVLFFLVNPFAVLKVP